MRPLPMPRLLWPLLSSLLLAACAAPTPVAPVASPAAPQPAREFQAVAPRIALVLGGGAARGFAHVGVIRALEAQGIAPDIVVGTSAGSLVGALYAAGYGGADLQRVALQIDESAVGDWSLPDRGVFKGEALQAFVNAAVQGRPLERLNRRLAVVATDLQSGEKIVFQRGDTGMAVRASSSVPGVFRPVGIGGREYVDGGLTSPVPVRVARSLGAQLVIAVDVSNKPRHGRTADTLELVLQTFAIMGQAIAETELAEADVVIRPDLSRMGLADFGSRRYAIEQGEKAAAAAAAEIRRKIEARTVWVPYRD